MLQSKTYWLSETPDSISVGWDASMVRIVTTATFLSRFNADTIHVFNAHFDHMGKLARLNSAKLILNLAARLCRPSDKLIFMGDLNMQPDEEGVVLLAEELVDTRAALVSSAEGPDGTFNDFQKGYHMERRIDYIFVRNARPSRFRTITERRSNGLQLSDHYAIICGLSWN
jgi:endonuclease/exonuclease/phosphatase family metal-dependent hydrolase